MSTEKELHKRFLEIKDALINQDVSSLKAYIDDEYVGFSLNGTRETKADVLEFFRPGQVKLSQYVVKDVVVEVEGEMGFIAGEGFIQGSFQDFEFEHDVLFTDIFKLHLGEWIYRRSQVTEISPSKEDG